MFKARLIGSLALALTLGLMLSSGHVFAASRNSLRPNMSSGNFMLNGGLSFSDASGSGFVNGASYDLDSGTVQNTVTNVFNHTLFVSDGNGNITVYDSASGQIAAQVSQNSDGSADISYSDNTQATTASFNGTLSADGTQMSVNYQAQGLGGNTVNNQENMGGNDVSATFTATVNWITSDQIPAAPTYGQYQLSSDGGVVLSWTPGSSGGNVTGYNIYRTVFGTDTAPQFLGNTSDTTFTDESPEAIQNAQSLTGVMYTIYAVGTTNIESPTDVVVYVAENPMDIINSINAYTN